MSDAEVIELASNLKKGVPMATPVFDGASEEEIKNLLTLADLPTSGQTTLHDGRTGEQFDRPVTVGLHVHVEVEPPGRRQDACPFHRTVQPGHPAAAGRQMILHEAACLAQECAFLKRAVALARWLGPGNDR